MIEELSKRLGLEFFPHQVEAIEGFREQGEHARACLFHRTGAGKSITSLAMVAATGAKDALVIAPPSTHDTWVLQGAVMGVHVEVVSHAKFRQKDFKVKRSQPVIADEFHLFGGHNGMGWKKFDRLARSLQAPLVIASATPNYNDAERVYCIQHVLDPMSVKGGYLAFLYQHCVTEENPFGRTPLVDGFKHFDSAERYLEALPNVYYLPDNVDYDIVDMHVHDPLPFDFKLFGLHPHKRRIMASQMEARHTAVDIRMCPPGLGTLRGLYYELLTDIAGSATGPIMVFAAHATVATAVSRSLTANKVRHVLITGDTPKKMKLAMLQELRENPDKFTVLVGTASLATGTDGLDKIFDTLVILDDTDDDALRRQLIGRIMPRGSDSDASNKRVFRIVPTDS